MCKGQAHGDQASLILYHLLYFKYAISLTKSIWMKVRWASYQYRPEKMPFSSFCPSMEYEWERQRTKDWAFGRSVLYLCTLIETEYATHLGPVVCVTPKINFRGKILN